jgi:hypothetical protein
MCAAFCYENEKEKDHLANLGGDGRDGNTKILDAQTGTCPWLL